MIQVTSYTVASTTNALANTDLQSAPSQGVLLLWIASSQTDTVVSFSAPPRIAVRNVRPMQRTNGIPLVSDDSPVALAVNGGEQCILNITIVTAATCAWTVKFIPQAEL